MSMNTLGRWFERNRYDASGYGYGPLTFILNQGMAAYIFRRMRYYIPVNLVRFFTHLLEFMIFVRVFDGHELTAALTLRILMLVIEQSWLGFLNVARDELNITLFNEGKHEARAALSFWIHLCIALCLALMIGCSIFLLQSESLSLPMQCLLICMFVCLALRMFSRTLVAGCNAIGRLYVPIIFFTVIDLVLLGGGLLIGDVLGAYLPSILLVSSTAIFVPIICRRALRYLELYGIRPSLPISRQSLVKACADLSHYFSRKHLSSAASAISMKLIENMAFFLAVLSGIAEKNQPLFALIYILTPLLNTNFSWPRLFYMDFVNHALFTFKGFHHKILALLLVYSLFYALFNGLIALAAAPYFMDSALSWNDRFSLMLIFIAQGVLGLCFCLNFARHRFAPVLFFCASSALTCWAGLELFGAESFFPLLGAVLVLNALVLTLFQWCIPEKKRENVIIPLTEWTEHSRQIHTKSSALHGLLSIEFLHSISQAKIEKICERFAAMSGVKHIAFVGEYRLLLHVTIQERANLYRLLRHAIQSAEGTITSLHHSPVYRKQSLLVAAAQRLGFFGLVTFSTACIKPIETERLIATFLRLFPNGKYLRSCHTSNIGNKRGIRDAQQHSLRAFLNIYSKRTLGIPAYKDKRNKLSAVSLHDKGLIEFTFILPHSVPHHQRQRWFTFIQKLNIQKSLRA